MTFSGRPWNLLSPETNQSPLVKLLRNRGITDQAAADRFFTAQLNEAAYDPLLLPDMAVAVERLRRATRAGEKVMVYGDYDVDGVSGAALLLDGLRTVGGFSEKNSEVYLPSRFGDGYGLSSKAIKQFAKQGVTLLVTVDCGTTDLTEIALAKKLGLETIVLDHHLPGAELPAALAVVNPKREGSRYQHPSPCATGLAFKLIQALAPGQANDYLDLVALATVVDCVPLLAENRVLVREGLTRLQKTTRIGLATLCEAALGERDQLTADRIAFRLGPMINVAGRLGDPGVALKLLLTDNKAEAAVLVEQLTYLNKRRQQLLAEALQQAQEMIDAKAPIVVIKHPSFLSGIAGIMAARLQEELNKPVMVAEEGERFCVGSARAAVGFDVTEALATQAGLLEAFGGHVTAAGFTIKKGNWAKFVRGLAEHAAQQLTSLPAAAPSLSIDCELNHTDLDWPLIRLLQRFQPFGHSNPEPLFLIRGATVTSARLVGADSKHLKLNLRIGAKIFPAIAFRAAAWSNGGQIKIGEQFTLACHLQENVWQGTRSLQLQVVDAGREVVVVKEASQQTTAVSH